jgi:hypothetical protein
MLDITYKQCNYKTDAVDVLERETRGIEGVGFTQYAKMVCLSDPIKSIDLIRLKLCILQRGPKTVFPQMAATIRSFCMFSKIINSWVGKACFHW